MNENDPMKTSHDHGELWHLVSRTRKGQRSVGAISADLTAATDTYDLELVRSLYAGLADGHPNGDTLRRIGFLVHGARTVVYSDEAVLPSDCREFLLTDETVDELTQWLSWDTAEPGPEGAEWSAGAQGYLWYDGQYVGNHVTGIPMGGPATYSVMTVWSRLTLDLAAYLTSKKISVTEWLERPVVPRAGHFKSGKIQGDDVVAFGNYRLFKNYTDVVEMFGNVPSDGANNFSKHTAIFCERTAYRPKFGLPWEDLDLIKVRPLVSRIGSKFQPGETRRGDPLLTLGSSQRQQIKPWTDATVRDSALWMSRMSRPRYASALAESPREFLTHHAGAGLGHISHRSWAYQWRRYYEPVVKDVWWVLRGENATLQGVIDARILSGLGNVPRKTERLTSEELLDELEAFWTTTRDAEGVPIPADLGLTTTAGIWRMIRKYRPEGPNYDPLIAFSDEFKEDSDLEEALKERARFVRTRLFRGCFIHIGDLVSRINDVRGYNKTWRDPVPHMPPVIRMRHFWKNRKHAIREARSRLQLQAHAMRGQGRQRPVPESEWQFNQDIASRYWNLWLPIDHPRLVDLEGARFRLNVQ
jgi:hypothetical protein